MLEEPQPPCPDFPRYSALEFPPYRFLPGLNPHPRNHPEGHSYGKPEENPGPWTVNEWRRLTPYLFGVDLYNYAYWWESHEKFESLWISAGRSTPRAQFLQGMIQIAGANLHWHRGNKTSARNMAEKGVVRLRRSAPQGENTYMGVRVARFTMDVRAYFDGRRKAPALIRLEF